MLFFSGCSKIHEQKDLEHHDIFRKAEPIKKPLIILDPGHGGSDPGAENKAFHLKEKDLTLKTAILVQKHLKNFGYTTHLTRQQDVFVDLDKRVTICKHQHGTHFVSIHFNSAYNKKASGVEVFYSDKNNYKESKRLADCIQKNLVKKTHGINRGIKRGNFKVIRVNMVPAVLVEAGFLSNSQEACKFKQLHYLDLTAQGIAIGIKNFIESP